MNVLIVYSHPCKKSYTFNILNQLLDELLKENHTIEVSDLYAMDFQTDMTEQEYEREGFCNMEMPLPNDVVKEQEKIENADCIIFLYPLWWSDCPAKLKGWFDRVYSIGYAYGYDEKGQKMHKMKPIPQGLAICTAGHTNNFLVEIGIEESIRTIMINDRLGPRFVKKELIILGGTLNREKVEQIHKEKIKEMVKQLKIYST